jgi:hypothetical protein
MNFGVLYESIADPEFPPGYYHAHVPSLGLTTHGLGIAGAREAALDLVQLWLAEKRANGDHIIPSSEVLFSTLELPDDALQSA